MTNVANVQTSLADYVTAHINAAELLAAGVTADRAYQIDWDLEDLDVMRVTVVPGTIQSTMVDRQSDQHSHIIEIGIQQRVTRGDNGYLDIAELDELVELVGDIAGLFRRQRIGPDSVRCMAVEHVVLYSPEHLDQFSTFTSLLRLTFRYVA